MKLRKIEQFHALAKQAGAGLLWLSSAKPWGIFSKVLIFMNAFITHSDSFLPI